MFTVDNAIIMAAGISSRFAPLSYEIPKALIEVKGEILIERQIRQLRAADINEIFVVVGYKAEQFDYLQKKFDIKLIKNEEYMMRNNHSSIYAARNVIRNSYICSADNYFSTNPFEKEVDESYYAAVFADGNTPEWCMTSDADGYIQNVEIGGNHSWYMFGHAFWSEEYSKKILHYLEREYDLPETKQLFWENIFMNHLDVLKMKIRKYPDDFIFEFDSIDELRQFDDTYITNTRSQILKDIANRLGGLEADITRIVPLKNKSTEVAGIQFFYKNEQFSYTYFDETLRRV